MKTGKTMTGALFSYPVRTAREFCLCLSQERSIPFKKVKLLTENNELQEEDRLYSNVIYWIFIESGGDRLREWIDLSKLNWIGLSRNTAAVHLLEQNMDKVDWGSLSGNPAAISLLEGNLDKVDWSILSENPAAIPILEANQDKIDWFITFPTITLTAIMIGVNIPAVNYVYSNRQIELGTH
jgi:hypothetical protein